MASLRNVAIIVLCVVLVRLAIDANMAASSSSGEGMDRAKRMRRDLAGMGLSLNMVERVMSTLRGDEQRRNYKEEVDVCGGHVLRRMYLDDAAPFTRWQLRKEQSDLARHWETHVRMPMVSGPAFDWKVAQPAKLVSFFCKESPTFRAAMSKAFKGNAFVASLVFYADEVTPGNPLAAKDMSRKFIAFYLGIDNLGALLRCDAFWLPIGVLRLTVLNQIEGGCSACFAACLRLALTAPSSFAAGVVVQLDKPRLLFARYAGCIADEAALHTLLCLKGASGTR